jgi:hypothetical protein
VLDQGKVGVALRRLPTPCRVHPGRRLRSCRAGR